MQLAKLLLLPLILFSLSFSSTSFRNYDDMCSEAEDQSCPNYTQEVRNLQLALNSDSDLGLSLVVDGKWGKRTQEAVEQFQAHYGVTPVAGYVGGRTKRKLTECYGNLKLPKITQKKSPRTKSSCYAVFKKHTNMRRSYKVFKDVALLRQANGHNTSLKVDISEQRLRLYVNGKVALCSPCTTGAKRKLEPNTRTIRDKRTPKGSFRIQEKIADKRSTIFGKYYRNGKLVYKGDRRKYKGPPAKYVGASLKNWMRLTSSGIGLHASKYVKRYPGTNGCIRLPYKVAQTVFAKVKKGTKVTIVN